jgi:periplasmic divalent cation tolerance protein
MTTDDPMIGELIAKALLEARLVACVQSFSIHSQYKWENKLVNTPEIMLQMKSKCALYPQIEARIKGLHHYEVPEIIMTPILDGNQDYLRWIDLEVVR